MWKFAAHQMVLMKNSQNLGQILMFLTSLTHFCNEKLRYTWLFALCNKEKGSEQVWIPLRNASLRRTLALCHSEPSRVFNLHLATCWFEKKISESDSQGKRVLFSRIPRKTSPIRTICQPITLSFIHNLTRLLATYKSFPYSIYASVHKTFSSYFP